MALPDQDKFKTIKIDIDSPIATICFDRPKRRNALSLELMTELCTALEMLDVESSVRGIILTGSEKAFSAGADLNDALATEGVAATLRFLTGMSKATLIIERLSKPVVAVIRGFCFTGGLELALACDMRFAGTSARFSITSSRIGSVAGMGGTQRLPRIVGLSRAKDIVLSARELEASEALSVGMVDALEPDESVMSAARDWIHMCSARAPLAVWLGKLALNAGADLDLGSALTLESVLATLAAGTADRAEGMRAVLEKRQPAFRGM